MIGCMLLLLSPSPDTIGHDFLIFSSLASALQGSALDHQGRRLELSDVKARQRPAVSDVRRPEILYKKLLSFNDIDR